MRQSFSKLNWYPPQAGILHLNADSKSVNDDYIFKSQCNIRSLICGPVQSAIYKEQKFNSYNSGGREVQIKVLSSSRSLVVEGGRVSKLKSKRELSSFLQQQTTLVVTKLLPQCQQSPRDLTMAYWGLPPQLLHWQ